MLDSAATPPARSLVSARIASMLGIVAVAVILTSVAVLTAINLRSTSTDLDRLTRSQRVGDAYSQMTIAVALAGVHANEYRRIGDPKHHQEMLAQIREALRQEGLVKQLGTDNDRRLMAELEARYSAELQSAVMLLGGADMLGMATSTPLILDEITQAFAAPTAAARAEDDTELSEFQAGFDRRSTAILIAFLLGLPILGLLSYQILRYERKDAIHADELRKLGQAVLTDGLTGLRNHRAFQEDLRRESSRASRSDLPLSVAMIDIDDFKEINDTLGHARGDAVLSQVGKLMTFLRTQDAAYRVGGDEFAMILPDTSLEDARIAMERLRASVAGALEGVTISAGVGTNLDGVTATVLRDHADMALYEAKRRGKNQVAVYSEAIDGGNALSASKMTALRELIKTRSVAMWFQPIFKIASKELLAFEALLRMPNTPELSGPEEAFEIAQRMGLSHELDMMCAGGALDAADELAPNMKLFINLDPATLIHSDYSADELVAMAQKRGIDASKVVFEITEKTAVPLPRLALQVQALHDRGFGVALDDVGAGNSGLEMMRLIRFDYVKIDRSVVLDAMNGGPGRAVILAIVAFARETGAFMIAEGIEDREMLESVRLDEDGLHKFWVQGVQGFLFGEPRPSVEEYTHQPKRRHGSAAA